MAQVNVQFNLKKLCILIASLALAYLLTSGSAGSITINTISYYLSIISYPNTRDRVSRRLGLQSLDHVDSPYETNWPGYHLPFWAKKTINFEVPADEEVCFVHIGKAGGSAVGCSLGFSLHCEDTKPTHGALSKRTTHTFHKDVYDCQDTSAFFLFVVRDPISRARSAFNYDRPDVDCDDEEYRDQMGSFYLGCPFYRFEDYVQNGLTDHGDAPDSCKRVAIDALQGVLSYAPGPTHFYYNYQYYYESVPTGAPVLVIRNEHIEEDWNNLEILLGSEQGRLNARESLPRNNVNTNSNEDDLFLSEGSIATLCEVLCNEIQQYKKILGQAKNISQEQLQESLAELEVKCPREAVSDGCPEPLPDITAKLEEERGYGLEEDES